jgi:hypothetical protein
MKNQMKKKRKGPEMESATNPSKWNFENSETEKSVEKQDQVVKKKKKKKKMKTATSGVDAHLVKNLSKKFSRNIYKIKNDFELGKNKPKLPKVKSKRSFALKNDLYKKKENTTWGSIRNISKVNQNSPNLKNFQSAKQNVITNVEEYISNPQVDKWEISKGGAQKDFKGLFTKNPAKGKNKKKKGLKNLTKKNISGNRIKNLTKRKSTKVAPKNINDIIQSGANPKILKGKKKRKKKKNELKSQKTATIASNNSINQEGTKAIKNSSQRYSQNEGRNSLQNTKEVIKKRDAKTVNKKKKPRRSSSRSIERKKKEKEVRTGWEMQRTLKGNEKTKKDTIFCVIKGYRDSYFVNGKELNGINELIDFIKAKKENKILEK